ncbi:MAG: hypothetical protein HY581_03175 [Nitrospirae bacterium]|nr:hypothetical protein [Nitrospirota bacterium]
MRGILRLVGVVALLVGCSTIRAQESLDSVETLLAASEDQVRSAVIQVLLSGGYSVRNEEDSSQVIRTGYRQEINSPWDWLLRYRFGVSRSRVDVTMTPENDTTTHLAIRVAHEGKDSLFSSWRAYETPLPQSAATQLRLIKNALGLL